MNQARSPAPPAIQLAPKDHVAVATRELPPGTEVPHAAGSVRVEERIPPGHKVALVPIGQDEPVRKYGQVIGFATERIAPGQWVHTHNLAAGEFQRQYEPCSAVPPDPEPLTGYTFRGYRRPDGRVGTRNYIAVISSVNCSASVSRYIAQRFTPQVMARWPHVDGVVALTHKGGCGLQYGGEDHQQLVRVLAGFARHPNVAGYVLVGLGCETASLQYLIQQGELLSLNGDASPPPVINMQELGGTTAAVEAGTRAVVELLARADQLRREEVPASELVLGTQCGGSDGNSGITANPALGHAADLLVAAGGTVLLAETPEVYGAEHLLVARAASPPVARKLLDRIAWWEEYTAKFGARLDNNPSPGNKEGGLTTIYEKSLGAVAKGGTTALKDVLLYAEPVRTRGLVFMDSPGYDPVSITGLVASGATLIAFTTGRGSCFGCKPSPSLKIATNSEVFHRMNQDMDLDAGAILRGEPVQSVGRRIFETLLEVASGRQTKSEQHGVGDEEFAPWSIGPVL